ncbi:oligo-1,6-glucosidase [Saccharopolyspora erythraea]|uniref:alpha-amylase family glycosyl hydrolase n=1 Tax=Saccharopolyspora erythraea TaxID=1836 RepID=UPI001BEDA87C|nr:alpha-amylase family glycosyl hydrolase [Saccharopolyspora erythraea]QUH01942.1 oligo-1,6-glucosidase [Saccharopolyspora erythraea]
MALKNAAARWLTDSVLYQVYTPSFADSDGDGIGDLAGITARLEHLAWLGVDAVWLTPCFASPFRDGGYDVRDHLRTAPRHGTDDDLTALVEAAGRLGIRVLLDLVAGHTSDTHAWFRAAADDPADHRYIWAAENGAGLPEGFTPSPGTRPGGYLPNFFPFQPALNFGYARPDPREPWRQPTDADGPVENRAALVSIMDRWLRLGVAGFRVDMAHSLVKDDPGHGATAELWRDVSGRLRRRHPGAVLLSEWGDPAVAIPAGFDVDLLDQFGGVTLGGPLRSLWHNRQGVDWDGWDPVDCYFAPEGGGSFEPFRSAWQAAAEATDGLGVIGLPTANHDFARLACGTRTADQLAAAFTFQLTWPTLPVVYYGDEIGMRYVPGLGDVEGSVLVPGYNRAGSRTPMQWDAGPNAGFSTAPADRLILPVDPDPRRPAVSEQRADENSLLALVRRLIGLRRSTPELGSHGSVEVLHSGYPLVYLRGGRYLVVVNPREEPATHPAPHLDTSSARLLEGSGIHLSAGGVSADGFGYGIHDLSR